MTRNPFPIAESFADSLRQWLESAACEHGLPFLLAFADDGVIWGQIDQGRLVTAREALGKEHEAAGAELRAETLQQARVFGPTGELHLFRTGGAFEAWLTSDGKSDPAAGDASTDSTTSVAALAGDIVDALDEECYRLWGEGERAVGGFTLMREGAQGFLHAPPLGDGVGRRAVLRVCHYVGYDDKGQAAIRFSRLVGIRSL